MPEKKLECASDNTCIPAANLFPRVQRNEEDIKSIGDKLTAVDNKIDDVGKAIVGIKTTLKITAWIVGGIMAVFTPAVSAVVTIVVIGVLRFAFGI